MQSAEPRAIGLKVIIAFHLISFFLWLIGQTGAVIAYDTVAEWGLQDPRRLVDPAIVEVNRGVGLADTLVMLPLHAVAAIGLVRWRFFGVIASWLVFGITVYWPTVFWSSQVFFRRGEVTHNPTQFISVAVPGTMMLLAVWGTFYLAKNRHRFH